MSPYTQAIRRLKGRITTPSKDEDVYTFIVIGIGHVLLGASLVSIFPIFGWQIGIGIRVGIGLIYWFMKERGDLKRGGDLRDGIIDTLLVTYGAFYEGSVWWPIAGILMIGISAIIREVKIIRRG